MIRHPELFPPQRSTDHTRRPRPGQGIVEFALILPLLLLFLLGIIEVGRMLAIFSSVSSAVQQAARYGSVGGDTGRGMPYYLDCAGMRQSAKNTSLLQPLSDSDINIRYDTGLVTQTIGFCATSAITPTLSEAISDGDRVVISTTTIYRPLVPLVPLPPIPMTIASAHTIFTEIIGPTPTPLPNPDLAISKVGYPDHILPGGSTDLTYTLQVTNTGPVEASNIVVTDTLPAGMDPSHVNILLQTPPPLPAGWTCNQNSHLIICQLPFLGAGSVSSPITLAVTAPLTPGLITNVANVSYNLPDPQPSNNTASAITFIASWVDLAALNVSMDNPVSTGGLVHYAVTVRNNNWVNDGGPQVLTDTFPDNTTFVSVSQADWSCPPPPSAGPLVCTRSLPLSVGSTAPTVTLTLNVPVVAPASGYLTNTVSATSDMGDPFPLNNTAVVTTAVTNKADLALFKFGPTGADAGSNYVYTLHVTNNGPAVATNVRVTDTMPATVVGTPGGTNWTCATAGTQVTCVYTPMMAVGDTTSDLSITAQAPDINGQLVNRASAGSDEPDPQPANNTASATTTITTCHSNQVDPNQSAISASPTSVGADSSSTAQILVTLRDSCGNVIVSPPNDPEQVTLTSSRGGTDRISLASGYANPTSNGQVAFNVGSSTIGTSTYSAVAKNSVTSASVNLAHTAQVNYVDDCVALSNPPIAGSQSFLQFGIANNSSFTRRLTSLSLTWPAPNGSNLKSVTIQLPPAAAPTTVWNGNSGSSPFTVSSGGWSSGTDAARTIAAGQSNGTLLFNFHNFSIVQNFQYVLSTTWDDGGGGHVCSETGKVTH